MQPPEAQRRAGDVILPAIQQSPRWSPQGAAAANDTRAPAAPAALREPRGPWPRRRNGGWRENHDDEDVAALEQRIAQDLEEVAADFAAHPRRPEPPSRKVPHPRRLRGRHHRKEARSCEAEPQSATTTTAMARSTMDSEGSSFLGAGGSLPLQGSVQTCPPPRTPRPPSARSLTETLQSRDLFGRSIVTYRSDFDKAVFHHDDDRTELAKHLRDCHKVTQEVSRQQAAQWRERFHRKQQFHKLRYCCQDPHVQQLFANSPNRNLPSPADLEQEPDQAQGEHQVVAEVGQTPRSPRSQKDFVVKPRQPLEKRLKNLLRNAHLRRQQQQGLSQQDPLLRERALDSPEGAGEQASDSSDSCASTPRAAATPPQPVIETLPTSARGRQGGFGKRRSMTADGIFCQSQQPTVVQSRTSVTSTSSTAGHLSPVSSARASVIKPASESAHESRMTITRALHAKDATAELAQAFLKHDTDRSGTLDHAEILECLNEVGVRPKSLAEKADVRSVVFGFHKLHFTFEEFVHQFVPRVREALSKLRRPRLVKLFRSMAKEGCTIPIEEAFNALRLQAVIDGAMTFEAALTAQAGALGYQNRSASRSSLSGTSLDMEQFLDFVRVLQERCDMEDYALFRRIVQVCELNDEEEEFWRYDLVELWRMFHKYDPFSGRYGSSKGALNEEAATVVLRESGYMTSVPSHKSRGPAGVLQSAIQAALRSDGTLGFQEFLGVVQIFREFDRERLRRPIDEHLTLRSGMMDRNELRELLVECAALPKAVDETSELLAIMQDVGLEGPGILGREDVVVLCQRVMSKRRAMQREHERQYAITAGWTDKTLVELRETFHSIDEDMSGALDQNELLQAVDTLKGCYFQSADNIHLIFLAVGVDTTKEVKVDYLTFMRIIKMLEESEARWQAGASVGFNQDHTDKLFAVFKNLERVARELGEHRYLGRQGMLPRDLIERMLVTATEPWREALQLTSVLRLLHQEPADMDFSGFIRTLRHVEYSMEGNSFEELLAALMVWDDVRAGTEAHVVAEEADV